MFHWEHPFYLGHWIRTPDGSEMAQPQENPLRMLSLDEGETTATAVIRSLKFYRQRKEEEK